MSQAKNQSDLMVSVSGIRGVVGQSLDQAAVYAYAKAYGSYFRGVVVVGRDSRKSGIVLKKGVIRGLLDADCQVIDLGIATTPTVEMAVLSQQAAGGVIITASHNPAKWNGLKFLRPDGTFLRSQEIKKTFSKLTNNISLQRHGQNNQPLATKRRVKIFQQSEAEHIKAILKVIDVEKILNQHFRVALDTVNGAGGRIAQKLLRRLGCEIFAINAKMDGNFAHWPEPTPANLESFSEFVRDQPVEVGFALDPDGDRLVVVKPDGQVLNEEYTLALVVRHFLSNIRRGPVVINQSTSRVHEDIVREFNCDLIRAPVGEINVIEEMISHQAVVGGEGNGGVIDPRVHYGRDALVGMVLILEYLVFSGESIARLVEELPRYEIVKDKVPLGKLSFKLITTKLKKEFQGVDLIENDGLRFAWPSRWLHIRPSNTEPIIRLIAEAPTKQESLRLIEVAKRLI